MLPQSPEAAKEPADIVHSSSSKTRVPIANSKEHRRRGVQKRTKTPKHGTDDEPLGKHIRHHKTRSSAPNINTTIKRRSKSRSTVTEPRRSALHRPRKASSKSVLLSPTDQSPSTPWLYNWATTHEARGANSSLDIKSGSKKESAASGRPKPMKTKTTNLKKVSPVPPGAASNMARIQSVSTLISKG